MKDIFLVDADDTIVDFHGASASAIQDAFSACGLVWKPEFAEVFREVNDGLWSSLERKEITREWLIERRFPLLLQRLGYDATLGANVNEKYLHFLATRPRYADGAENFLAELKKRGRIYVVTNGTAWIQKSRFALLGLDERVNGVFISQNVGYDKPAKEYVDYVIGHIDGFEKARAVWIGDSLYADMGAAKTAGIMSIWYNPKNKPCSLENAPDYTVAEFAEILEILQKNENDG